MVHPRTAGADCPSSPAGGRLTRWDNSRILIDKFLGPSDLNPFGR